MESLFVLVLKNGWIRDLRLANFYCTFTKTLVELFNMKNGKNIVLESVLFLEIL